MTGDRDAALRTLLLQSADAVRVAGQSLAQALAALQSAYPQLPTGAQRDRDHDRTGADDRDDDEPDDVEYDDQSAQTPLGTAAALLSEALRALRALQPPTPAPVFPLSTAELRRLIDAYSDDTDA